ncbi:MAG: hypothetical protein G01um101418_442 [Parcubacteria group bacterium Gr01-1014_18]|nr:MAG: hypothetical protein Greene041636_487 [Parcubacteria group bacterium Greene0416_36]TSC81029.1 MAG: hypothetical protein G01um101418_442 [Parcubacteria group bacterium Gr01-1014_18]TSC98951.1 MAG: hypothetical protein Greene101420_463 [Parcubacteria group bacterium Greene1014_20]TSD06757.1 MAG: hypothetical protein Greene07142_678 [Parcubacteria group bacterium Greene0714_2]
MILSFAPPYPNVSSIRDREWNVRQFGNLQYEYIIPTYSTWVKIHT